MTFGRTRTCCRQRYRSKIKMKTPDLAEHVASEAGVGTSAAKKAVEAVFGGIADAAKEGERANFLGLGKSRSRTPGSPGPQPGARCDRRDRSVQEAGFRPDEADEACPCGLNFGGQEDGAGGERAVVAAGCGSDLGVCVAYVGRRLCVTAPALA
jgi:hypothetical protein